MGPGHQAESEAVAVARLKASSRLHFRSFLGALRDKVNARPREMHRATAMPHEHGRALLAERHLVRHEDLTGPVGFIGSLRGGASRGAELIAIPYERISEARAVQPGPVTSKPRVQM